MPLYDYSDGKHVTESRQGIDCESIPCPRCGTSATRVQVYPDQYMQAETGPVGGKKNEIPPSDIRLGQEVSEYVEASEEVAHAYEKHEESTGKVVKRPNLYRRGLRRAKELGANVKV